MEAALIFLFRMVSGRQNPLFLTPLHGVGGGCSLQKEQIAFLTNKNADKAECTGSYQITRFMARSALIQQIKQNIFDCLTDQKVANKINKFIVRVLSGCKSSYLSHLLRTGHTVPRTITLKNSSYNIILQKVVLNFISCDRPSSLQFSMVR